MDNFQKESNFIKTMCNVIFVVVAAGFVCFIVAWIFLGILTFTIADNVSEKGLKSVIERIWCGPDNHCL